MNNLENLEPHDWFKIGFDYFKIVSFMGYEVLCIKFREYEINKWVVTMETFNKYTTEVTPVSPPNIKLW